MDDLIAFLKARLDEDEQWALAASRPPSYADGVPGVPEAGVRWQWVERPNWEPTRPDPVVQEFVAEPGMNCTLVSVETWPVGSRMMRRRFATEIVEMDSAAAGHIVRHDPARVLREVAAMRQLLDFWSASYSKPEDFPGPEWDKVRANAGWTVRLLALPYADHPDYREEWRP